MTNAIAATSNYQVPKDATTHTVKNTYNGAQSSDQDWGNFSINNFQFVPQGAFIDNTGGGILTILIQPLGLKRSIASGGAAWISFPAPDNMVITVTTVSGTANIYWVNFPVIETTNGSTQAVSILGQPIAVTPTAPIGVSHIQSNATPAIVSSQLLPANANRKFFSIQNNDPTANIFIVTGAGPATLTNLKIAAAGGYYEPNVAPTDSIQIIASINGSANSVVVVTG